MSTTDLEAVAVRRSAIARALSDFQVSQAKLEAELDELALTERVLLRLERLAPPGPVYPARYVTAAEPLHVRAVGMLKSWIPGRGE